MDMFSSLIYLDFDIRFEKNVKKELVSIHTLIFRIFDKFDNLQKK